MLPNNWLVGLHCENSERYFRCFSSLWRQGDPLAYFGTKQGPIETLPALVRANRWSTRDTDQEHIYLATQFESKSRGNTCITYSPFDRVAQKSTTKVCTRLFHSRAKVIQRIRRIRGTRNTSLGSLRRALRSHTASLHARMESWSLF